MSTVITAQGVSKSFGDRRVLTDVSFAVDETDRIAFVGVNGSGKSTLLRLLAASRTSDDVADQPDDGLITKRRDLTLEYVPQEPQLPLDATVHEVLRTGLRAHAAHSPGAELHERDHEIEVLTLGLGLPAKDKPISELSLGERRRVALATALLAHPDVLALDEPTNHLDAHTVAWLEEQIRDQAGALLLVTHDRYFLDRVATRIFELDRGKLYTYEGGYTSFLEKQAERLGNATERERVRRSFVRRELEWIRRGPKARSTKQQARIERFDNAVAAGAAAKEQRPDERILSLRLPTGPRLGKTVLDIQHLGKSLGGKRLFRDLTLLVKPGDRIGIVGPNGAGKTTLVRTLLGELAPDEGTVTVGVNTRFAFLDQARAELDDDDTVLKAVAGEYDHVQLEDGPIHVRSFLRMMLFDDRFADTKVGKLSGGERNRVQLAKLLRQGGNVLVLDEPTNDLDLITLGVLEAALLDFPGVALVVSHDRWFLDRVATGILAFEDDGQVTFYEGGFADYLAKWGDLQRKHVREGASKRAASASSDGAAGSAQGETASASAKKSVKLSFKEQRELEGMETAIAQAEARVVELDRLLSGGEVYVSRAAEVPKLVAELEVAKTEVERLYARWAVLLG